MECHFPSRGSSWSRIKSASPVSPAMQVGSIPTSHQRCCRKLSVYICVSVCLSDWGIISFIFLEHNNNDDDSIYHFKAFFPVLLTLPLLECYFSSPHWSVATVKQLGFHSVVWQALTNALFTAEEHKCLFTYISGKISFPYPMDINLDLTSLL